ncbi:Solid-state culture expressed protein (Aos23) [Penicillium paradoxum]|uniref:Solid-state culture expressed protein (Aos23) n=1 Tax=Penicillium paradoxum TaxID=176176 RepID=UPI002549AD7E|nr:Solid-state culture expressed protein (Aos23) [Penicillium paradoxum]KAJ5782734.1 Solid-state culture expressed protein (Aos23) [Penicillium paradoxum]
METVNKYVNAASTAASTALWGENPSTSAQQAAQQHGEEPISGIQGKGLATDPYDAGNREDQPGAIATEANTAIQLPIVDGKRQDPQGGIFTTHPDPSTGAKSTDNLNTTITTGGAASIETSSSISPRTSIAQPISSGCTESLASSNGTENEQRSTAQPVSSASTKSLASSNDTEKEQRSTAQPVSSGSTEPISGNNDTEKEQRSTSQAGEGESSEAPHPPRPQDVSKEALEGPQGPAPRPAEEFENESQGKKGGKNSDIEKIFSSESKDSANSNKSPTGSNKSGTDSHKSGKQGTMSKVKESVKKHLHHSSS